MLSGGHNFHSPFVQRVWKHAVPRKDNRAFHQVLQLANVARPGIRALKPLNPKQFVRGKFDTWFLVQLIKAAVEQLQNAARAASGDIEVSVRVERSNVITLLAPFAEIPPSLEAFVALQLEK